ncbi:MAG TPA: FliA/WhiG family RNA polymerase sigma factor [Terriglobales bacterium]
MLNTTIAGTQTPLAPPLFPAQVPDSGEFDTTERELITGRPAATETESLILAHLQDVRQIARNIARRLPSTVQLDDLVQAGTLGLIDASRRFDPSRPMMFAQYARIRITGAIYDSLRDLDWASRYMRSRQQKLESTTARLEKQLGRQPNSDEVAEAMGMDLDTFYEFASAVQEVQRVELDAPTDDEHPVREQLHADPEQAPDAVLLREEIRGYLRRALDSLPDDERTVMSLYYFCDWRMEAIARHIHRTESRVSQIHSRAVARLRQRLSPGLRTRAQHLPAPTTGKPH